MLDIVESDFASGHRNKAISKARKTIKAIKTLEEFREIAFTFTCNYDTFFRPDHNGISVATCNNHDWTEVNTCHSSEDYYDIAIKRTYNKLKRGKKWVLLEIPKYDQSSTENLNENFPKYLLLESYNKEMVPSLQPRYDFKKGDKIEIEVRYIGNRTYLVENKLEYFKMKRTDKESSLYKRIAEEMFVELL